METGKKYIVTQGTNFYGVLADGTLSTVETTQGAAEANAQELLGTEIIGLTNGNVYKVTKVLLTPPEVNPISKALGSEWGFTFVDNPDWRNKITFVGYGHSLVQGGAIQERTWYFPDKREQGKLIGTTSYPDDAMYRNTTVTWVIRATGYKEVRFSFNLE